MGWRKRLASACQQRARLPPQMPHKFVATGNVLLKTVLVSEAESETLGKVCFMTGISPC